MYVTIRIATAVLATFVLITVDSAKSLAQCGGGSSARSAASSGGEFAGLSSGSRALAFVLASRGYPQRYPSSRVLSVQNQYSPAQQKVLADRQQMMRQQAEQRYEKKQKLLTIRRERADATRAARVERALARLEAKGKSGQPNSSGDSESLYAAKSSAKLSPY